MNGQRIPTMVETGGPCSGKSTGLARLTRRLRDFGVQVFSCPEAATLAFTNGLNPLDVIADKTRNRRFQTELARLQRSNEAHFRAFADLAPGDHKLYVTDRGLMDNEAYLEDPAEFSEILVELGLSLAQARDEPYDLVGHLVSAADGAPEFYTVENNPEARTEGLNRAIALDQRTRDAWVGHRNFHVIPNVETLIDGTARRVSFDEKMDRLVALACGLVDIPVPLNLQRKFAVRGPVDVTSFPGRVSETWIEQVYLASEEDALERRIRRMVPYSFGRPGGVVHIYSEKRRAGAGLTLPTRERLIDRREYETLKLARDPATQEITKRRYSFIWRHRYFKLDVFENVAEPPILEVDLTEAQPDVDLPPFVRVGRDVTNVAGYTTLEIAAGRGSASARRR